MLPVAAGAEVRAYLRRLFAAHPRMLAWVFALHLLAAVAGLAAPWLLGDLVERVSRGTTAAAVDRVAIAIAGFVVAQAVLVRAARLASARLGEAVLARLREEFVDRVLAMPLSTVERAGTGDLITRASRDVGRTSDTVQLAVPTIVISLLQMVLTVGAIALVNPILLLPCLVAVPVLYPSSRWYFRRAAPGYLREGAAFAGLTDGLTETVEGARTVETLGLRRRRVERTRDQLRDTYAAARYTLSLRTVWFPLTEFGYALPGAVALVAGGWFVAEGWATVGEVTAGVLYLVAIIDPLDRVLSWFDELQLGLASFARIVGVRAAAAPDVPPSEVPPRDERLEARDVRYAYVEGRDVLHGVSLDVRPGERIAMVGPSGAGKSTLGRLLAGIHAPRAGTVEVGGVPLAALPLDELRGHVALVTQEHHVFLGTLRDNLTLARPGATDDELLAALATVDALDWVEALPGGLGTTGPALSPAQAQQLALARLVLADPHTLVLDEATSLIDPRAARHLERSLAGALEGRTVIAIAHRLFSAHDADRVAVVEDGRITELGSHDELVAAGGAYAALWRSWHGSVE
ncbi:ABC transporter ATP-binding protein [Dactylosporangium sucinum]|uniref:Multidrug ABC transporter ATP-binding protein n=1 Tax=Dactylosporangium sucinum TaxID=1424081 RepID=A0A917TCF8_9ACTN|nr:ABC transporter ATP-binding protein [Dactylosporangium sucinum]GGM17681.1 multidrug ABC transporter ATP-binding protein [Dactylosporangium sucinum]